MQLNPIPSALMDWVEMISNLKVTEPVAGPIPSGSTSEKFVCATLIDSTWEQTKRLQKRGIIKMIFFMLVFSRPCLLNRLLMIIVLCFQEHEWSIPLFRLLYWDRCNCLAAFLMCSFVQSQPWLFLLRLHRLR